MLVRPRPECAAVVALGLLALAPSPARAAWPSNPALNVSVSSASKAQRYPEAAPDGSGGIIVAWDDQRGGLRDIYARRVDGTGTPRWTLDGVALCTATGEQYEPKVASDGSGGAIVTWSDYRGTAFDIYAQRVDSTGTVRWTANGVAVCAATGWQSHPAIISDGSGGAILAWDDGRTGATRIYAQRVNAAGVPQWTANGVLLTNSVSGQARPVLVSDGAGGAIVAWEDYRNGESDLFAQRIRANGTLDPAWPAGGLAFALNWSDQSAPVLAVDGAGGAFVAWAQWNGGVRDIVVKRLLVTGVLDPAWPANGRFLIADFYDQSSPAIVADGSGGALVSWDDQRGTGRDIYAQHVLASGAIDPAWPAGGLELCPGAPGDQMSPRMVADGAGGAIVLWQDPRDDEGDLYVQHALAGGTVDPAWPATGRGIATANRLQVLPALVSDGAGGAVAAWLDQRVDLVNDDEEGDIYAQGVAANGQLGDPPLAVGDGARLALALDLPSPNPLRAGALVLRFALPVAGAATLELFDVAGRRVAGREVGSLGPGRHAVELTPDRRPAAGIYFVRLRQGAEARAQRVVLVD